MILKLVLIAVWIYALSVFKRGKLGFFHFLVGSVGLFLILLDCMPYVKDYFIYAFVWALGFLGDLTGMFESYAIHGMFFINHEDSLVSMYVDLECSGIIEMLVFTALLMFFPVYKWWEKIGTLLYGLISICLFNYIRIFIIIAMIFYYGSSVYALAHVIVGRFVFYVLTIMLYFHVFTRWQIMRQKVGKFSYENINT